MKTLATLLALTLFSSGQLLLADDIKSLNPSNSPSIIIPKKISQSPLFEGKSTTDTYREQLQKNRLQARMKHIQDLRKAIRDTFEESENIPLQQKKILEQKKILDLEQKILDLGDECLNLNEVANEELKRLKKIKKLGDKINTQCEKLSDKLHSSNITTWVGLEKSRERWKAIDELIDDLLGFISL